MSDSVYICKADTYDNAVINAAVKRIFDNCECTKKLNSGTNVCVKVNMIGRHKPEDAATPHPAVVKSIILALQNCGVENITVADSGGGTYNANSMNAIYKATGMTSVCEETGAKLYTECKWMQVPAENAALVHKFNMIMPVVDADFIINVPKLKTHMMMRLTNATKNLFGVIPGLQKAEMHMRFPQQDKFGTMLVDLCEAVHPDLTIVDAVDGMEGDGPNSGTPRHIGLIMGGENTYTLDVAACKIVGLTTDDVPYLKNAVSRSLCPADMDGVTLCGDDAALVHIDGYKLPKGSGNATFAAAQPKFIKGIVAACEKAAAPRPKINTAQCIGCGRCAEICPAHTIKVENKKAHINTANCIRCFCCHEVCPADAINVKRFSLFNL